MSSNEKMWGSICTLMEKSFWGKTSCVDSLIRDFRNEIQEFIQACQNDDILNAKEEAADVLMLLLCLLYRVLDTEACPPDEIAERVTEKLRWRYAHLYTDTGKSDDKQEDDEWTNAKKIEHRMNLMFCGNENCLNYRKVGLESVQYIDGKYWCKQCRQEIIPSKSNTLLYRDKNAWRDIRIICASIVAYAGGDDNAAKALSVDHPKVFKVLHSQLLACGENEHNGILAVFAEYVQRKYHVTYEDVQRYLSYAKEVGNQMKSAGLHEEYCNLIKSGNSQAKQSFTITEWQKVMKGLRNLTFDVAKTIESSGHFRARSWDNQVVHKYLLRYPNRNSESIIECMTLIHYAGAEVRDLTVELSNMYNCVVGCRFCASGALPGKVRYLDGLDYVRQLNTCLSKSGINPDDFKNFYVSFAGIGEPSAHYESVATGMAMIRDLYPNVQFNIATFGYRKGCFAYWEQQELPIRTLQIPLYHTELEKLKAIVPGAPSDYDLTDIIAAAVDYQETHPACRVKVNYIPMKGINDSDTDVDRFIQLLIPFKEHISIKVSFLNYTTPAEENGFTTSGVERMEEIRNTFEQHNYNAYVFGTAQNTALGCGQLAQNGISGQV